MDLKSAKVIEKPDNFNEVLAQEGMKPAYGHRLSLIQNCKKCNGKPEEERFDLPTMEGYRCKDCWEVLCWKKK